MITNILNVDGLSARLILDRDDEERLTVVRTCDTRTALARGLAEYFGTQKLVAEGGREIEFKAVNLSWADHEQPSEFPSVSVVTLGPGEYAESQLAPHTLEASDGSYLRQTGQLTQMFQVSIWCTDVAQRIAMSMLAEDAGDPSEFMAGFRLELPYYHGSRASYLIKNVLFQDGPDAQRRWRLIMLGVEGELPKYRIISTPPTMHTEINVDVT